MTVAQPRARRWPSPTALISATARVGPGGGFGNRADLKADILRLVDRPAGGRQTDADPDAGVLQVESVRVPL
jgi:hypothetical protein